MKCNNINEKNISVFQLLEGQRKQFKMLETTINTDKFVSKKDIEMRLGHARRLHEIYMRVRC